MENNKVVSLSCKNCGGKLKITEDIEQFSCQYCGREFLVRRGNGIVSLAPLIGDIKNSVEKVNIGMDKTTSELAIQRLKDEIKGLEEEYDNLFEIFSYKTEDLKGKYYIGYIAIISLIIASLLDQKPETFYGLFIFGVFVSVIVNLSIKKKKSDQYKSFNQKMDELLSEITDKELEIDEHKDFISSN